MMTIHCNGREMEVPRGLSIAALIERLGIDAPRFAVEVNREVVTRSRHPEVELQPGDEVNIVTPVGGG